MQPTRSLLWTGSAAVIAAACTSALIGWPPTRHDIAMLAGTTGGVLVALFVKTRQSE